MVSVVVVEPNALLRLGLLQLLKQVPTPLAVAGMDYRQLFSPESAAEAPIDLMLLSVPDTPQRIADLTAAAHQGHAPLRLLLLADTATPKTTLQELPTSVSGYISKHAPLEALSSAVSLVLAGGTCFPSPTDLQLAKPGADAPTPRRRWYDRHAAQTGADQGPAGAAGGNRADGARANPGERRERTRPPATEVRAQTEARRAVREARLLKLTKRQYQVLTLMAKGHSFKHIGRLLDIAPSTVKTHIDTLYRRLGVHNRNAAVFAAFSRGATLGARETRPLPPALIMPHAGESQDGDA